MADLAAVPPVRGTVIHLHDPNYRPSAKARSVQEHSALCGYLVRPPGIPLAAALKWTSREPTVLDPRPTWRWCRPCVGHAVELAGIANGVLHQVEEVRRG